MKTLIKAGLISALALCAMPRGAAAAAFYYDVKGVEVCQSLRIESAFLACMKTVIDKRYSHEEATDCRYLMLSPEETNECLKKSGKLMTDGDFEPSRDAHGSTRTDAGLLAAGKACDVSCRSLTCRRACLAKVDGAFYYDGKGAGVCATLAFESDILSCMEAAKNKRFSLQESFHCKYALTTRAKIGCVHAAGKDMTDGSFEPSFDAKGNARTDEGLLTAGAACEKSCRYPGCRQECLKLIDGK